ncbi:MAG TPA: hypothetical protein EYG74_03330 [Sulfurimonas autotrophica]|nr:hypothetical protein [Sulfurimonas autotrophica]
MISMTEHSDNDQAKHAQANRQIGMIGSSLEHQVLEQLFATDTNAEGFSAVKAIQLANEQGQKIYTITKDNYQEVIPQLQLASHAIADIRAAAQAGLTVTTHQKRISINGYTGEGYIILNDRGVGAYLINGGLYGGLLVYVQSLAIVAWVALGKAAIGNTLLVFFSGTLLRGLTLAADLLTIMSLYDGTADCLGYIIGAMAIQIALTFMLIMFGLPGILALTMLSRAFTQLTIASAKYHCKPKSN